MPSARTATPTTTRRRPLSLEIAVGALTFVGATAVAGGLEMLAFPDGNVFVKGEWLDDLPVDDYRLPGVVLAGVVRHPLPPPPVDRQTLT